MKYTLRILFFIIFIAFNYANAFTYTWNGHYSNNWNVETNWDALEVPGVPGPNDIAIFSDAALNDCYILSNVIVGGIEVKNGFTKKIIQTDHNNLYIGTGGLIIDAGVDPTGTMECMQFGIADVKIWGDIDYKGGAYFNTRQANFIQYPAEDFSTYICLLAGVNLNENKNIVITRTPVYPFTAEDDVFYETKDNVILTKDYYDGYGRPVQNIFVQGSESNQDIVTPHVYDDNGSEPRKYLPYVSGECNGLFKSVNVLTDQANFYNSGIINSLSAKIAKINTAGGITYTEDALILSPEPVAYESAFPGDVWTLGSGHSRYVNRRTNTTDPLDLVLRFDYSTTSTALNPVLPGSGSNYPAGTLSVTETEDENRSNIERTYTNGTGQTILKRTVSGTTVLNETYYVYDLRGRLVFVVPGAAVDFIKISANPTFSYQSDSFIKALCFVYIYDAKDRVIEKNIPGKGVSSYVYDNLDRVALSQDAAQKAKTISTGNTVSSEWTFIKYDAIGRTIMTGTYASAALQTDLQAMFDNNYTSPYESRAASGGLLQYSNNILPTLAETDVMAVTYYDANSRTFVDESLGNAPQAPVTRTTGLQTGTWAKDIETGSWLHSESFYDDKDRVIQQQKDNPVMVRNSSVASGTYTDRDSYLYDFTGKVLKQKSLSNTGTIQSAFFQTNTYNNNQQPDYVSVTLSNNGVTSQTFTQYAYNELGQLVAKEIQSPVLQSIDYTYNMRGWLTDINNGDLVAGGGTNNDDNNDVFGISLRYENPVYQGVSNYNGNISSATISIMNPALSATPSTYGYYYQYYPDNKLYYGVGLTKSGGSWVTTQGYEELLSYYKDGRISAITRTNAAANVMDNLIYNYATYTNGVANQILNSITESGSATEGFTEVTPGTTATYTYSASGQLTFDPYKNINLSYNSYLGLLEGVSGNQTLNYRYSGSGEKLRRDWTTSGSTLTTYYNGPFVYEKPSGSDMSLSYILLPDGMATFSNNQFGLQYNMTDHLGNVWAVVDQGPDGNARVIQQNHYYPFGLTNSLYNNSAKNDYLYNGKELQAATALYDYGARMYDPAVARFWSIDPDAEMYSWQSSYVYGANNPIRYKDKDGRGPDDFIPTEAFAADGIRMPFDEAEAKEWGIKGLQMFGEALVTVGLMAAPIEEVGLYALGKAVQALGVVKTVATGVKAAEKLPTLVVNAAKTPNIAKNIESAQKAGAPSVLTRQTDKKAIVANRREALRGKQATSKDNSLDEYPYASSKEGGKGAQVSEVPVKEQQIQGGEMSNFFKQNKINDGDKYKVIIKKPDQ